MKFVVCSPRLLRDDEIRNIELRSRWYTKFAMRMDYQDDRINGAKLDELRAEKVRLARHKLNKLLDDKERARLPANVISLFQPQAS